MSLAIAPANCSRAAASVALFAFAGGPRRRQHPFQHGQPQIGVDRLGRVGVGFAHKLLGLFRQCGVQANANALGPSAVRHVRRRFLLVDQHEHSLGPVEIGEQASANDLVEPRLPRERVGCFGARQMVERFESLIERGRAIGAPRRVGFAWLR